MAQIPHLDELAIVAILGVLVSVVLARFRLPTVAGLLVAGAIAGPRGLGIMGSSEGIRILAELGVVFLLFSIGLEFSIERLRSIWRQVAIGGGAQVGGTIAVVAIVASMLGEPLSTAILYGFVFSLSSTAIVLRALAERRELHAPHGKFIVGALIFQDVCVVPMVLLVPILATGGETGNAIASLALAIIKAGGVVLAVVFFARAVVPRVMGWVDASRSREVFLLAVIGICIGTAWLTSQAGLSLALGAFLGGMVVADTEFGHRALGDMLPLRDAFVSVFFVSLGMLFDISVVLEHPLAVALMIAGFMLGKGMLATMAALLMRFPARAAWLAGVGLAQFGEFGFVLATMGEEAGLLDAEDTGVLLSAGIVTMFLTPVLVRLAPHLAAGERLLAPLEAALGAASIDAADDEERLDSHVIVVGYGIGGKLVGDALARSRIRYVALELNAQTVKRARAVGEPVYYGDATSAEALEHAGIDRAAALVIVMNDPSAMERVVYTVRRRAPSLPILVRTHYTAEGERLEKLGATEVIAEEVESGVEILARVLRRMEVPRNVIDERVSEARSTLTKDAARTPTLPRRRVGESHELASLKIDSVLVRAGSRAVGKNLVELDLRQQTGALAVAIRRDGLLEDPPRIDDPLEEGDVVYVVGSSRAVANASVYLDEGAPRQREP
jgi:CPA2 family monovalent cation:H+ antiporter-2